MNLDELTVVQEIAVGTTVVLTCIALIIGVVVTFLKWGVLGCLVYFGSLAVIVAIAAIIISARLRKRVLMDRMQKASKGE